MYIHVKNKGYDLELPSDLLAEELVAAFDNLNVLLESGDKYVKLQGKIPLNEFGVQNGSTIIVQESIDNNMQFLEKAEYTPKIIYKKKRKPNKPVKYFLLIALGSVLLAVSMMPTDRIISIIIMCMFFALAIVNIGIYLCDLYKYKTYYKKNENLLELINTGRIYKRRFYYKNFLRINNINLKKHKIINISNYSLFKYIILYICTFYHYKDVQIILNINEKISWARWFPHVRNTKAKYKITIALTDTQNIPDIPFIDITDEEIAQAALTLARTYKEPRIKKRRNSLFDVLDIESSNWTKKDIFYNNYLNDTLGGLIEGREVNEAIRCFIISIALNHHPHDVGMVIIDKNGDIAEQFKNLPHIRGIIRDTSEEERIITALKQCEDNIIFIATQSYELSDEIENILHASGRFVGTWKSFSKLIYKGKKIKKVCTNIGIEKDFVINKISITGEKTVFYKQQNKTTQLEYLINHIMSKNIKPLPKVILPPLPSIISYERSEPGDNIYIGLYDCPKLQIQDRLRINNENILIIGDSESGKTTLLQTIIRRIAENYSPANYWCYILDFGARRLQIYEDLNHVGAVICDYEQEKLAQFFRFIKDEIYYRMRLDASENLPSIAVIIDEFENFYELYGQKYDEDFLFILENCLYYNIDIIVTSNNILDYKYSRFFLTKLELKERGRGITSVDGNKCEFQAYLPFEGDTESSRNTKLKFFIELVRREYNETCAKKVLMTRSEYENDTIF